MESNRGMRCVILCAFVLILVVLCSSAVIASFAVQQYINQISADVEAALKLSEGEAGEVYSRISYNIGQLDKELMIRYEEALSLLRSGEDASFPSVNISSPIEPHFKEKEALRNEITAELQSILDQYGEAGKRQYSQDSTFIRNMAKETISYAVDAVPRPSLPVMDVVAVPFDTAGKAENAQTLKQNVDKMKKTAEEAKWLHEEFERVRNDNLPIVDYHYKQLGEVNRQLNSVIDKYKQLEQSFPEEADRIKNRVKKEQEEWEKQKAYLEEIASKVDENARDMSQFSVSGPYIEPPAEDEERQMLLARLSEANSALSNLMNSTREVADNVVKDLQKEEPYIFDHFLNPHPYKDVDVRTVDIGELSLLARETLESAIEMNQTSVNRILSAVSNLSSILSQVVSDGSRILGEIASLSIALDLSYSHSENSLRILSKDIASKLAILNQRVQDLNDIIQDTSNWIPELSSELSRRAGIANQFVGQYKNEYSQVYNAKVGFEHAVTSATTALYEMFEIKRAVGDIWTYDGRTAVVNGMSSHMPSVMPWATSVLQLEVKRMFKEGEQSNVKSYLDRFKQDYIRLMEKIQPIIMADYEARAAQAYFNDFVERNGELHYLAGVLQSPEWGSPVSNFTDWYYDKEGSFDFSDYMQPVVTQFFEGRLLALNTMIAQIDEFFMYADILLELDSCLAGDFRTGGWVRGNDSYNEAFQGLTSLDFVFDKWLEYTVMSVYDFDGRMIENAKTYTIALPKTQEARDQAWERYSLETQAEELKTYRKEMTALLAEVSSVQGFIEYCHDRSIYSQIANPRHAALNIINSDKASSSMKTTASEVLELVSEIEARASQGPVSILQDFYDKFARAYETRSIRNLMELLSRDWQSSDGERRRDIEDRLNKLFRSWDEFEVAIEVEYVGITEWKGDNALYAVYTIMIEGISFEHDFTYSERGRVTDTLLMIGGNSFIIDYTTR